MSTNHEGALPVQDVIRVSYDSQNKATLVRVISTEDGAKLLCAIPDDLPFDDSVLKDGFRGTTMGWKDAPDTPELRVKIKLGVVKTPARSIEQILLRAWGTMNAADYREFHRELTDMVHGFNPNKRPNYIA